MLQHCPASNVESPRRPEGSVPPPRQCFIAEPPPILRPDVDGIHLDTFQPKGVSHRLLTELMGRDYSNGEKALSALLAQVRDYEGRFGGRLNDQEMLGRFDAVAGYAGKLLVAHRGIESIFFFGGACRGRANAKDVDLCCILKPSFTDRHFAAHLAKVLLLAPLYEFGLTGLIERVPRLQSRLDKTQKTVAGLPIDITVKDDFYAGFSMDADLGRPPGAYFLLNSGPMLCFSRGRNSSSINVCFFPGTSQFEAGHVLKRKGLFAAPVPVVI